MGDYYLFILVLGIGLSCGRNTDLIGEKGDDAPFDQVEGRNGTIDAGDNGDNFGMKIIGNEVRTRGGAAKKPKKCKNTKVCLGSIETKVDTLINGMTGGCGKQYIFQKPEQVKLSRGFLSGMLPYISREYSIVFQLKFITIPSADSYYHSIIHFTTNGDHGVYGYRTPALWIGGDGKFYVASAIDGNPDYDQTIDGPLATGQWYTVEISQKFNAATGKYTFEFTVNANKKWTKENSDAQCFKNVKVYRGDPWYDAADAYMRELTVITN